MQDGMIESAGAQLDRSRLIRLFEDDELWNELRRRGVANQSNASDHFDLVVTVVSIETAVQPREITGRDRRYPVAGARHLVMWGLRRVCGYTLQYVAFHSGWIRAYDHASVSYAVQKVESGKVVSAEKRRAVEHKIRNAIGPPDSTLKPQPHK